MNVWAPGDPRSVFAAHEAFHPEFLVGRAGGLDVIGTLLHATVAGGLVRKRVRIRVPPPPQPLALLPFREVSPHLDHDIATGPSACAVLHSLDRVSLDVHRVRERFAANPKRTARYVLRTDQMDGPLPEALLREASAGPGDRVEVVVHLRSRCVQACRFCGRLAGDWPHGHAERDCETVRNLCDSVIAPANRNGAVATVGLEADDLTRHPRFMEVLDLVHRASLGPVHVVTPGNALADRDAATRLAAHPAVDFVVMTLFGSDSAVHDDMAGRPGAFREVVVAARNLAAVGRVHLHFHLLVSSDSLPQIAGMLRTTHHFQAGSSLVFPYADYPKANLFLRDIIPRLDHVRDALATTSDLIRAGGTTLVDFPRCAVPPDLSPRMVAEHLEVLSDYPVTWTCRRCSWFHQGCVRIPRGYLDAHGTAGLDPR